MNEKISGIERDSNDRAYAVLLGCDESIRNDGNVRREFVRNNDGTSWGANLANSPIFGVRFWSASPDSYPQLKTFPRIFVSLIAGDRWSDGTLVMKM